MRITRDLLIRLAKENTEERAYNDKTIIAAYLTGSLLKEEPLLGGTTDIDLIFVHNTPQALRREIKALSADIHLDIAHRAKKEYDPPRELRINPWLGHELYDPMLLYETKHFFEFTQASLRAGFDEPKSLLQRAYKLLNHARKIWMDLQLNASAVGPKEILQYLEAVNNAINAIVGLTGAPLPERRLMLEFPARAEAIGRPGFTRGLLGLLGGTEVDAATLTEWLPAWKTFFMFATESTAVDGRIHPARLDYYQKAIEVILAGEEPLAALWSLLHTWTLSASVLPENQISPWQSACQLLNLGEDKFEERLQGLDHYLDEIEEMLEKMVADHGFELSEIY
ncbi:MAG: hypothetical protein B6243_10265 [Anaerolineaceae bacterium 4572_5.2]|nr:MAG: hypothetical protein B6243_10265 [Anaerolineaceae bacterium 4572_5.2]